MPVRPVKDVTEAMSVDPTGTVAKLRSTASLALARQKPSAETPSSARQQDRFVLREDGLFFRADDDELVWLSSPIKVVAETRSEDGSNWGRLLHWRDADGREHTWAMPMAGHGREGAEILDHLLDRGLAIGKGAQVRARFREYLCSQVAERRRLVRQTGWTTDGAFVTPMGAFGGNGEGIVFCPAEGLVPLAATKGDEEDWRAGVARLAEGNTRLVFAISIAFAGPLLSLVGAESGGIHYRGASSTGKTTSLVAGSSVWGDPGKYMRSWRATSNGLEGIAALHNDGTLFLDELSQVDPSHAGEAAYMLANGQGKTRATKSGAARPIESWRLLFLSTGEESMSSLMMVAGKRPKAGQELRFAEVPADAGCGLGAFEDLHGFPSPGAFADAIKCGAAKAHGAIGERYLKQLVLERSTLISELPLGIQQQASGFVGDVESGQVGRVASRFSMVGLAGELATAWGLTGWQKGAAVEAARTCFHAWLTEFGTDGTREEREMVERFRQFFERYGASRFQELTTQFNRTPMDRAGFCRVSDGTVIYYMSPGQFRELCEPLRTDLAAEVLCRHGLLKVQEDRRYTTKRRVPGERNPVRFYEFVEQPYGIPSVGTGDSGDNGCAF